MRILPPSPFHRGPFSATIQTRFKKHASTAQTRLETRTLVSKLDSLALHHHRLDLVLRFHALFLAKKRFPFVSVQILSRCSNHAGIDTLSAGGLLRKYPYVFQVFTHPVHRNACFKFTDKFVEFLQNEDEVVCGMNDVNVIKIKKILSMSVNGRVRVYAIRLMRRELGLPENFNDSIIELQSEISEWWIWRWCILGYSICLPKGIHKQFFLREPCSRVCSVKKTKYMMYGGKCWSLYCWVSRNTRELRAHIEVEEERKDARNN